MRKLNYPETAKATNKQISKAKDIIKKLTFTFDASSFENPSLQKHYRHLEGLALDRDAPDDFTDLTGSQYNCPKYHKQYITNLSSTLPLAICITYVYSQP
ncbi:X-ray repair cross-complementing protein 6 [Exaiptasia diaphana]|nr:X-ray repair cross-complementing protein 6 [Exaiptasia diaphana]